MMNARFGNNARSKTYGTFNDQQIAHAVRLFHAGKDTLEIANVFGVGEDYIYNSLPKWRLQHSQAAA